MQIIGRKTKDFHTSGKTSLELKVRLYFVLLEACRGEKLDQGTRILALGEDVVDGPQPVYRIPSNADIVIYYSTAPGIQTKPIQSSLF